MKKEYIKPDIIVFAHDNLMDIEWNGASGNGEDLDNARGNRFFNDESDNNSNDNREIPQNIWEEWN